MMGSPAAFQRCILSLLLLYIPTRSSFELIPQGQIPHEEVLIVGVLDLNPNNVDAGETAAVTDRLRMHLGRQSIFQVIERQKLTNMMTEMGFRVSGVCNTDECIVEVGKILGVRKMVAGSVSRVGRLYSLQVRIIDVESSTIDHYALRDVNGIEEVFTVATLEVARELAQKMSSQIRTSALPKSAQPVIPTTGQIRVVTEPEGAGILIDNMQYGSTPATLSLKAGRHELVLALYEYLAHIDSIDVVGGETQTIHTALIPIPTGLLEVQTQVVGASVFVDNKERGETPLAQPLRLPQGYHIVELLMGGKPIEIKQVFVADTTSTVVFEYVAPLQPLGSAVPSTGQIHVLTEPAGAEILIDNVQYGSTPATRSLAAGTYEIVLALNGYFAHIDSIAVVAGEFKTVQIELVPVPTGFLEIRSRTVGATVIVDKEEIGKTPLAEPLTLTQGYHVVELRKSGYKSETREVFIQGGSTLTLSVDLTIPPFHPWNVSPNMPLCFSYDF